METDRKDTNQFVGQELILKGREVYSKQGNHRIGWLKDFPQGGSSGINTATLEGPELVIRGRQVFNVNDSSKAVGYLSEDFANMGTGGSSGTQQNQQTR